MFNKITTTDSIIKDLTKKVQALLNHADDMFAASHICNDKADTVKLEAMNKEAELRNQASAHTDEGMRASAIADKIGALLD